MMSWERHYFQRLLVFKTGAKRLQGGSQLLKVKLYFGLILVDSSRGDPRVEASKLLLNRGIK